MSREGSPAATRAAAGSRGLAAVIGAAVKSAVLIAAASAALGVVGACSADGQATVLAASSLAPALEPLAGDGLRITFAGSPSLVSQLEAGAPAALLVVADAESLAAAEATGRIHGQPTAIAANRLVLATADGNPGGVASLADLAREELLVGLCAPEVPCGRLAAAELAEAGVTAAADTEESSVAGLASKLRLGEIDAGLVYASDAEALGLTVVHEPALDLRSVLYAAAVDGELSGAAEALAESLAAGLLADHGFGEPPGRP